MWDAASERAFDNLLQWLSLRLNKEVTDAMHVIEHAAWSVDRDASAARRLLSRLLETEEDALPTNITRPIAAVLDIDGLLEGIVRVMGPRHV
jgi:hypothetical protein